MAHKRTANGPDHSSPLEASNAEDRRSVPERTGNSGGTDDRPTGAEVSSGRGGQARKDQEGQSAIAEVGAFVAQLSDEERMLILLKGELYEGSWQAMLSDLSNRLEGKPYIFKLANRIRDDITRIEKLQRFEEQHQVDLTDFVEPPEG